MIKGLFAIFPLLLPGCTTSHEEICPLGIMQNALLSTVVLRSGLAKWDESKPGCGVAIGPREVLTVGHALKGGGFLGLELHDGSHVTARVVKALSGRAAAYGAITDVLGRDLALLRLTDGRSLAPAQMGARNAPYGACVFAIGAPEGAFGAVVRATLSVGRLPRSRGVTIFGAPLEPGWSGGPVFDCDTGALRGIISRGGKSVSAVVSAEDIDLAIKELRQ